MSEVMEHRFTELTVHIDRGTCIGSANCARLAPEVFELDEKQIIAFRESPPEIERERLLESCRVCPVDALSVTDADGEQLVP